MDQQALSEAFGSYFSCWKASCVPTALMEWNGSAAAPQHLTLCGHCGQHCLSWLGGSARSHWLCCPSQSIGILKTFLHVTRNTKEQANSLSPRSLETDKVLPQEPKWNSSVTEPEQMSLDKSRATATDPTLSNPQCRKRSKRVTLLWLVPLFLSHWSPADSLLSQQGKAAWAVPFWPSEKSALPLLHLGSKRNI